MVLKGSIGTFDVISIIQMVTSQQVTGVLYIHGKERKDAFVIYIDNGMIVHASPKLKVPISYFVERLEKARLISRGQFKLLMDEIKKGDVSYIDISKRFTVPLNMIKRLLQTITYESLHKMYSFKEGIYEFEQKNIEYDKNLLEPINTEFILMETSRILDEVMHNKLQLSDDTVFKTTSLSAYSNTRKIKNEQAEKIMGEKDEFIVERSPTPITYQEKNIQSEAQKIPEEIILELVDGKRTLQDIYYMSLLSKNDVILEITNLLKSGKITTISQPKKVSLPKARNLLTFISNALKTFLILFINLAILVTILYYSKINPFNYYGVKTDITYSNLLKYIGSYQHIKLANAIEIFKLEYGSYPETLKELVNKNILKKQDLTFPYGSEYYYSVENNKYILIAPKYIAK